MHFLSPGSKNKEINPEKNSYIFPRKIVFLIFQEIEFSGPKIKRVLVFSYISRNETFSKKNLYSEKCNLLASSYLVHFLSPNSKNKKNPPEKNSLYLGKWNFLALILRNLLYFLKRNLFLYFGN